MSLTPTTIDEPFCYQEVNEIKLRSITDSTIEAVKVFLNKAEVTRHFKFNIKKGQNQLEISGLPKVLDRESVRAEVITGKAIIHGVSIAGNDSRRKNPSPETSDTLNGFLAKKKSTEKDLERAKKSLPTLETFLGYLKNDHLDASYLHEAMGNYEDIAKKLDDKLAGLEKQLVQINDDIKAEKKHLAGPVKNENMNIKASIGIVGLGDSDSDIEILFIYVVDHADWVAKYEIHVAKINESTSTPVVILTYKGGITQTTGEDWVNVSPTLETALPTFGLKLPTLDPLEVTILHQPQMVKKHSKSSRLMLRSSPLIRGNWGNSNPSPNQSQLQRRPDPISSKSHIGESFNIKPSISIPSGRITHNVDITGDVHLNATISRVCVPKKDVKTYVSAKIKNNSMYNFLKGEAKVYLDGKFISKLDVPFVAPGESFDCPLEVDPSVRVTCHPRSKTFTYSGFFKKTANYAFSQRITVSNLDKDHAKKLKIIDQIHANDHDDSYITVKLLNPALRVPEEGFRWGSFINSNGDPLLRVSPGVGAQWHGADDPGIEAEALGRNGKLNWLCDLPPSKKVDLVLMWKVTMSVTPDIIVGLKL